MALLYFLGTNDEQKRKHLYAHLYQYVQRHPDHQVFYIVPENVKFDGEHLLLESLKNLQNKSATEITAMTQIQVTSFKRLAWYFLQQEDIYQQTLLTESGMTMLMRQVLKEVKNNLQVYPGECANNGFIMRMVDQINELRKSQISPEYLGDLLEKGQHSLYDTELKLHDLWVIYTAFAEKIAPFYIASEDIIQALKEKLKTLDLSKTHFVIDHYDSFSASEIQLVAEMANCTDELWLTLLMDTPEEKDIPVLPSDPERTYQRLEAILEKENVRTHYATEQDWLVEGVSYDDIHPDLRQFLNYWLRIVNYEPLSTADSQDLSDIVQIWESADAYTEILHIANKIKQLVATGKYRYRDFQILTRDIATYELPMAQIFKNSEIPYFVDESTLMSQHPFIEAINLMIKMATEGPRSRSIISFLRTEMIQPLRFLTRDNLPADMRAVLEKLKSACQQYLGQEQSDENYWRLAVDILENSVLAFGVDYKDWLSQDDWFIKRQNAQNEDDSDQTSQSQTPDEQNFDEYITSLMRDVYQQFIYPALQAFADAETNQDIATKLYQTILDFGMRDELMLWHDQDIMQGKEEEAERNEQVWSHFVQLLDEFVTIFGDDSADLVAFGEILNTGFENATYGMIPPTMDQLQISHFDRPGIEKYAGVFVVGLTNTTLPRQIDNKTILSEEDRQWLSDTIVQDDQADIYLAPSAIERQANENYLAYKAFSQARQFLILSYPQKNTENKDIQMSPYLTQMIKHLGTPVIQKTPHSVGTDADDYIKQLAFIGHRYYAHEQILSQLQHSLRQMDENHVSPFWQTLYQLLKKPDNYWQDRIYSSLTHKNIPENLRPEIVSQLYGKDLYLSVSQLESYYADPYSHFLTYGLRAQPRLKQELTPLEVGSFYHEALDQIVSQAIQLDIIGQSSALEQLQALSQRVFDDLLHSDVYPIFKKSARMNFSFQKLSRDVWRNVWAIARQSERTHMRPKYTEIVFGPLGVNQKMKGLDYPLANGGKLNLRGKIDRIDLMNLNGHNYLSVVDYKSSQKTFNWSRVYSGLMMQLIVYLHTAVQQKNDLFGQENVTPAGMFYSAIGDPLLKAEELKNQSVEDALFKEFKYSGYLIGENEQMLDGMDTSDYAGDYSAIYPLRKNKNNEILPASSNIMTAEEWKALTDYIDHLIIQAGNAILSGELTLAPYEHMSYTPSLNEYKSIAQFDVLLPENNYRQLKTFSRGPQKARNEFFELINDQKEKKGRGEDE